jgi:hypothetical protein
LLKALYFYFEMQDLAFFSSTPTRSRYRYSIPTRSRKTSFKWQMTKRLIFKPE